MAARDNNQRKRKEPRQMELHVKGNRSHVAIRTDEHGNRDDLLVKLTVSAPTVTTTQRLPWNLARVIDRSGSMGGAKNPRRGQCGASHCAAHGKSRLLHDCHV